LIARATWRRIIVWQPVRLRDELVQLVNRAMLSAWDVVHALDMAMACFSIGTVAMPLLGRRDDIVTTE
jgi:hypothetical protein